MKKSIRKNQTQYQSKKRKISDDLSDSDQIEQDREQSIHVNNSPSKKSYKDINKLHINIDSSQQIQSEILDQHNQHKKNINTQHLHPSMNSRNGPIQKQKQTFINSHKNQQPHRSPINRLTKVHSQQQKHYKQNHFKTNQYNQNSQQRNFSKKILSQYLKNVGCRAGDYAQIKIHHYQPKFIPVYKIINYKQNSNHLLEKNRKASDDAIIDNNSFIKNKSNLNNSKGAHRRSLSEIVPTSDSSLQLTLGSKIFLKHQKFNHLTSFSINKLYKVPSLNGIYIHINIVGKGYLICQRNSSQIKQIQDQVQNRTYSMVYESSQQSGQNVQGIWRCVLAQGSKKYFDDHISEQDISQLEQQQKYIVRLVNFHSGRHLGINENKQFIIDDFNEKGSRFILKNIPTKQSQYLYSLQYIPQVRRDYETSKSRQHASYQQGKKYKGQFSTNNICQIQIKQCQQSVITLQQQLLYIKYKIKSQFSLKLIEVILQTILPYAIPQFMHSIFIISQYIQKVFYQENISQPIAKLLLDYLQTQRQINIRQGLQSIRQADQIVQQSQIGKNVGSLPSLRKLKQQRYSKKSSLFQQKKGQIFIKIIKYLNKLCLNSKQNSQIFKPLLDYMISHPFRYYNQIICLVSNNIFFISQFYKREWYQKIIRSILTHQTYDPNLELGYESYFIILQKFCTINNFSQIQNQFLIFHTIKQPQFQTKNILLNLYAEGLYIFVRQSNKDMELMTYLESKQLPDVRSRQASSIFNRNSQNSQINRNSYHNQIAENRNTKRFSLLQKSSTFLMLLHKIVLHLQVLQMLAYGYNYSILKKYKPIIQKLLSYCNKQKHLVIKDYDFTRWVLKCAYCFYQPEAMELNIYPRFKLGIVDSPSGEAKFKQKIFNNQFFPIVLAGLDQIKSQNNTPRIPQKQALQLCNIFLTKCKQYYGQIKGKYIKINQIFETKAINGQPIEEYFDFLKVIFSNRLLKFKQKKKAQFMQYLQKLFENVFPQNQRVQQNQQSSLMIIFSKFLLKIISFDENYQNYLEKFKINTTYHENIIPNQLIKTKKFTVKKLNILNSYQDCSKIQRIKLLTSYFEKKLNKKKGELIEGIQQGHQRRKSTLQNKNQIDKKQGKQMFKSFENSKQLKVIDKKDNKIRQNTDVYKSSSQTNMNLVNTLGKTDHLNDNSSRLLNPDSLMSASQNYDSTDLLQEYQYSQKFLSLKRKSLQLLILILLNVNQEFIQESIQTLNYFIKNPTILNLSSFQLFSSVPKYQNQYTIRKRIIEQWYLTSDPQTFQLLTTVLRMLHRKVSIHINRISTVQIITDSDMSQISTYIADNVKQIKKMSKCINSWFKQQLFSQSSQSFSYFDQKLQNVAQSLNKSRQLTQCGCVSIPFQFKKICINLNCLDWMRRILNHIAKQIKRQKTYMNKGMGYNKNKSTTLKTYNKVIRSYTQKICFMLDFIIQPIQMSRLRSQDEQCYQIEYETNLQYMQGILYLLGQSLSQIQQARWIIVKIIQYGLIYYDVNLFQYLSISVISNLFQCKESIFSLLNIVVNYKQYEMIKIAMKLYLIVQSLDQKKNQDLVHMFSTGKYKQKNDKNYQHQNCVQIIDQKQYQNSWFYFLFRLNIIKKKYQVDSNSIPLLKIFYNKMLFIVLDNQIKNQPDNFILKSKKSHHNHNKLSSKYLKKIFVSIQRKKYLAYFIGQFIDSQTNMIPKQQSNKRKQSPSSIRKQSPLSKRKQSAQSMRKQSIGIMTQSKRKQSIVIMIQSKKQKQFTIIRQHIIKQLTDISLYDRLQRLQNTQSVVKTSKNSIYNQLKHLQLQYLQYYIYDLLSLLFLLDSTQQFQRIHLNLIKLNQKLRIYLVDKTADKIQTHYTQNTINKIITQLENKIKFTKNKNTRTSFDSCSKYQFFNIRNISFIQPKQIKKLQSTALRKWKKAVKSLQTTAIAAQSQFLYEIDHFSQIYNIKNKQQLNAVINNQDLLKKLVSVSYNLHRLLQSTQNRIFILSQMSRLVQSKYFEHLINVQQSRQILAQRILDELNQVEIGDDNGNKNKVIINSGQQGQSNNNKSYKMKLRSRQRGKQQLQLQQQKWVDNIFVICLKLDIVRRLQYFGHQYYSNSLDILINLLKKARRLFYSDSIKLRISQNQFRQVNIDLQPFYIILSIILQQISIQDMRQKYKSKQKQKLLQQIISQILQQLYLCIIQHVNYDEYLWMFDTQNKVNYKYANHRRIQLKLIQKLIKYNKTQQIMRRISAKYRLGIIYNQYNRQQQYELQQQQLSYNILQRIQIYNQINQINSNKDKSMNFLILLGLGSNINYQQKQKQKYNN